MKELPSDVGFFVEQHPESLPEFDPAVKTRPEALRKLLNPETCSFLEERKWAISLATIELDEATAKVVREVNLRNPDLPMIMWIVLKDEDGYWTNEFNLPQTRQRIKELESWINYYDLRVGGYGFDIEPPIQFAREFARNPVGAILKRLDKRAGQEWRGENPTQELADIIAEANEKGIPTEAYVAPSPIDRVLRIIEPKNVKKTYAMVYTSAIRELLPERFRESLEAERRFLQQSLKPGIYPAFGAVSSTGYAPGRRIGGGKPQLGGKRELKQDIGWAAEKIRKDQYLHLEHFRVFALTGMGVVQWTDTALRKLPW